MKRKFTLFKNKNYITKLPHDNYGRKSIFKNSNILPFYHINNRVLVTQRSEDLKKQIAIQKRAQQLKANNQELRTALESANIMAHNLKSPLMALELLLKNNDISDSNKSILKLALNKILKTADEIQLLDTAHTSYAKNNRAYNTNMNELIKECFDETQYI